MVPMMIHDVIYANTNNEDVWLNCGIPQSAEQGQVRQYYTEYIHFNSWNLRDAMVIIMRSL